MGANTRIEWCDHTVNFWWGCEKVSPACAYCYAESVAKVFSRGRASWGPQGLRWLRPIEAEAELLALQRKAAKRGVIERVFINSMSDTFEFRGDLEQPRSVLFDLVPKLPNLQLLLLTKRPQNVQFMVPQPWLVAWPDNVWIGTTVEDQTRANERIPWLLDIPAKVRFLSCEPLLGPVDLGKVVIVESRSENQPQVAVNALTGHVAGPDELIEKVHWVICGGESGPGARPMHPDWARSLRDQCQAAVAPFFFKQWGEWAHVHDFHPGTKLIGPDGELFRLDGNHVPAEYKGRCELVRPVGKKAAGRVLDGQLHNAHPDL